MLVLVSIELIDVLCFAASSTALLGGIAFEASFFLTLTVVLDATRAAIEV